MQRFIASFDWVRALPAAVRDAVEARYVLADIPAGGDICLAQDAPRHACKILSGYARLTRLRENGQRAIVAIYAPGHCFAERAIIAGRALNHTTTALVDTRVAMLPKRDFLELYATHGEIPQALWGGSRRSSTNRRALASSTPRSSCVRGSCERSPNWPRAVARVGRVITWRGSQLEHVGLLG